MGRVITVSMTCDRCGTDYQGDEIDLLKRDSAELVDGAKETLSDVPAFGLKMGGTHLNYDDLCSNCRDRLAALTKECGPVKRRGHKRGASTKQTQLDTDGADGKEKPQGVAPDGGEAKPKPPSKPVMPKNPPKPKGDHPVG